MDNPVGGKLTKRIYDAKEAAKYLGRSVGALREMYYKGKLPFIKDGSRTLFDISDLDAWIDKTKIQYTY